MRYSGIDLHSNNSVVTVTDEKDRVVAEKRLPNDLAKILGLPAISPASRQTPSSTSPSTSSALDVAPPPPAEDTPVDINLGKVSEGSWVTDYFLNQNKTKTLAERTGLIVKTRR